MDILKKSFFVSGFLLVSAFGLMQAQNVMDINAPNAQNCQSMEIYHSAVVENFKNVDRYRQFDYNKELVELRSENVGDTLLLNFFEDRQYKSVIQSVIVNDLGKTIITSQIAGSEFAYCYIVVSEAGIAISADFPQEDEFFFATVKNGQTYIGQMKKSVLEEDRLEGSEPLVEPEPEQEEQPLQEKKSLEDNAEEEGFLNDPSVDDPATPVTIDLLFTYTDSAAIWASSSSTVTDIDDVIDIAVAEANNVMANSKTGITFNVVHRHLTNYTEVNNSNDFNRFRDYGDGYMDEVHDLRNVFCADVMVFLAKISYTGGTGGLLTTLNGFSDDTRASCICRVQQSASGFTVVHEIGHNMGAHHHRDQVTQPGPNTPLGNYTSGWKGTISGTKYCTVMTYESASEYGESTPNYRRIPFFSSPDTTYNSVVIGNSATMDNARVLRESKTVTSDYRTPPTTPTFNVSPDILSFSNEPSAIKKIAVAGFHITGNINYVLGGNNPSVFTVTPASTWIPTQGGILDIGFIGSTSQNQDAYLTISDGGAVNKVVTLKYVACSESFLFLDESFEEPAFPPDCWQSQATTNAKWNRIEGTGRQPAANPHSGSGMLEFNGYTSSPAGSRGVLISPKIATNYQNDTLTFWMYRDNYTSTYTHRVNIYLSATPSLSGAMLLDSVHGGRNQYPTGSPSNQWSQYTVALPTSSMSEAYIIFEGVKGTTGNINMYIDDIKIGDVPIINTYIITATAGQGGMIAPSSDTIVSEGNNVTFNFTPSKSYCIDSVFVDNIFDFQAVADGYYIFTNITANHTIHVNFVSTIGISEKEGVAFLQIYPNPTNDILTINNEQLTIEKIEIYNVMGQCVFTTPNPSEGGESSTSAQFPSFGGAGVVIDVSHLPAGMYFLKIDGKVVKFVKE